MMGRKAQEDKRATDRSKSIYFGLFAIPDLERWEGSKQIRYAPCQSCRKSIPRNECDYSHKIRRWKAGCTPDNGQLMCRMCHSFIHSERVIENYARDAEADMMNGLPIEWGEHKDKFNSWRIKWTQGFLHPNGLGGSQ